MFKKIITSILLCFLLVCPVALTACKDKGNPENPITAIVINGTIKSEFYIGETLNIEGLKLTVTFKDASTTVVTLTNDMVTNFDTSTIGNKTFSVTYGGKTITHNYTVREIRATSIELTTPFKTTYYTGSTLNVDGGEFVATFENGMSETVTITSDMIVGFDTETAGEKTMTLSYHEASLEIEYTVADAALSNVAVSTSFKTEYFVGEDLVLTNGSLTVTYEDGNSETIVITSDMISNFDNTVAGSRMLTITYKTKTVEVPYLIKAITLTSIELHTPFKTEYLEGDALDVTGGKLLLHYNNGTTNLIDITSDMVSNFDNTYVSEAAKVLTITYNHFTTTLNYTITEVKVVALTLTQEFKNEYYVGESIVITGGLLTATYNNGTVEENIVLTAEMIADFDTGSAGEKTMTITYKDFTITYDYTVIAVELESIALTSLPTKTEYTYNSNEELNLTGAVVTFYYSNGTTETRSVTTSDFRITGFNTSIVGEWTITIKLKHTDFQVTFNYTVVEASASE